jgi:hypothetical protein
MLIEEDGSIVMMVYNTLKRFTLPITSLCYRIGAGRRLGEHLPSVSVSSQSTVTEATQRYDMT